MRYSRIEELDIALPKTMFDREAIPFEAAFLAGKSFLTIDGEAGQSARRFPIYSLVPMRPLPVVCS